MSKTYFLVQYDADKAKGLIAAKKSIITETAANVLMQDDNATITRKEDNSKWTVVSKRIFDFKPSTEETIIFLVVDVQKVKL